MWYVISFFLGAMVSLGSDKMNLSFIVETEEQVIDHLNDHLNKLSDKDLKSRIILEKMKIEETEHRNSAYALGGNLLPEFFKICMRMQASFMKKISYYM